MPQIIMIPPQPYQFPPLAPQKYLPAPAPPGRQSSPSTPKILPIYTAILPDSNSREPLLVDAIEECVAVFNQEMDTLSTIKGISGPGLLGTSCWQAL